MGVGIWTFAWWGSFRGLAFEHLQDGVVSGGRNSLAVPYDPIKEPAYTCTYKYNYIELKTDVVICYIVNQKIM